MTFAEQLINARKQAGFESAWKFYHSNGGRRYWPFTFVHYARMEKNRALPKPDALPLIIQSLRFTPDAGQLKQFISLYMREYLGGGKGADLILDSLAGGGGAAAAVSVDPTAWNKASVSVHMTVEQFRTLTADEVTCMCELVLMNNDSDSYTPQALARVLKYRPEETRASLEKLRKAGLVDKAGKSAYKSHFAGKWLTVPTTPEVTGCVKSFNKYMELFEKKYGRKLWEASTLLRAETGAMQVYCPDLSQAVLKANLHASPIKSASTGLFMVKAQIVRMTDL